MEIIHTDTNRGKRAIIVEGYTDRKINILKSGDVVYICSVDKKWTKYITTDAKGVAIIRGKNQHVCGYNPSDRKSEAKQLRVRSGKNLQENHLEPNDIKNTSLALYSYKLSSFFSRLTYHSLQLKFLKHYLLS